MTMLIFQQPDLAREKGIEQSLWKSYCYRPISETKRRLADVCVPHPSPLLSQAEASTSAPSESLKSGLSDHLQRLLDECIGMYHAMLTQWRRVYALLDHSDMQGRDHLETSVTHTAIYLGDLYRYKAADSVAADWYKLAVRLSPGFGNPHNQLAVIATHYSNCELDSMTRYMRAHAAQSPFKPARDNLLFLFEQNRQHLLFLDREKQKGGLFQVTPDQLNVRCIGRLIQVFGILFTRIDIDRLPEIRDAAMDELHGLLCRRALSDGNASQLMIGALFSIGLGGDDPKAEAVGIMASSILVELVTRLLQHSIPLKVELQGGLSPPFMHIHTIGIILAWLQANPSHIKPDHVHSSVLPTGQAAHFQQTISMFWRRLAELLNAFQALGKIQMQRARVMQTCLQSDEHLLGFSPLRELIDNVCSRWTVDALIDSDGKLKPPHTFPSNADALAESVGRVCRFAWFALEAIPLVLYYDRKKGLFSCDEIDDSSRGSSNKGDPWADVDEEEEDIVFAREDEADFDFDRLLTLEADDLAMDTNSTPTVAAGWPGASWHIVQPARRKSPPPGL